jgi:Fe-S-cluster containining protein
MFMKIHFTSYFEKYEALVRVADAAFERVKLHSPECVNCRIGCSDCCYALFDITLIEAIYINYRFKNTLDAATVTGLMEKANRADRTIYKIKRNAYRATKCGIGEDDILAALAQERVRCPLLNTTERCDLYEYRPITCRLYGIPTAIRGKGHACGLSGFKQGVNYPTVNMDVLHRKLYDLSSELIQSIRSKNVKMAETLIPLSMALLTEFDEAYLGIGENSGEVGVEGSKLRTKFQDRRDKPPLK